jgi:hypothetical protein
LLFGLSPASSNFFNSVASPNSAVSIQGCVPAAVIAGGTGAGGRSARGSAAITAIADQQVPASEIIWSLP